jgi:hypothetical protein
VTLPRETVLELMGLVDDALDAEAKARAEQLVASNDEARRLVEAMRESPVGDFVRQSVAQGASAAQGIADAVMIRLGPAAVPYAVEEGVVRLAPRPRRRSGRGPAIVASAGAVLVLAAGIALYLRAGNQRGDDDFAPVASVVLPPVGDPVASASQSETKTAPGGGGVEVNLIEAPSRAVSVFEIPLGAAAAAAHPGHSSVVVWVEEDAGTK